MCMNLRPDTGNSTPRAVSAVISTPASPDDKVGHQMSTSFRVCVIIMMIIIMILIMMMIIIGPGCVRDSEQSVAVP